MQISSGSPFLRIRRRLAVSIGLLGVSVFAAAPPAADDPYAWLEAIDGDEALQWVRDQNEATATRLTAGADYAELYRDALAVLNSASRLPDVSAHGKHLYNLWKDEAHPRGIYRRTTPEEFRKPNPLWEVVLDVDALAAKEGKPWVLKGAIWRRPDESRCLIQLSPGGIDAFEVREFDAGKLEFVPDGFALSTAKSRVAWRGENELFVATDFGPGTMTESGYPRIVKRWRRGTPLKSAQTLHEAPVSSVWAEADALGKGEDAIDVITEGLTFWTARFWQMVNDRAVPLSLPTSARVIDGFRGGLVIWLREDWNVGGKLFTAGSVVVADPAFLRGDRGSADGAVELVVAETSNVVVQDVTVTADSVFVTSLDNVRGRLDRFVKVDDRWQREPIAFPDNGAVTVVSTNADTGDAWVKYQSFTTPPTLLRVAPNTTEPEEIKSQAPTFDGAQFTVRQGWCTSADGTKVPYFVVAPKGMKYDGKNPVWMFSYGGFENALTPSYSGSYEELHGAYGKMWLERGGVFVLANIRGGGEFGPHWHQAALKENRTKAFEDFEAIARDLVERKITSPTHLGIEGRSNGGLLVAATMLRYPELYGAVVCGNPLLDMQRYHRLLAGASWVAEYGNPDEPTEWDFISRYSPYQNLRSGLTLPPVMFYTSTRDDRVHPGHARKMAAKMEAMDYAVDYYENIEGGHRGSVTSEQLATRLARTFAFLWKHCGTGREKTTR